MTAQEFKALRKSTGLTQSQLAKILKCGVRTIGHYEQGTVDVPESVVMAVKYIKAGMDN